MYSRLPYPRVRRTKRFSLTLNFARSPSFRFTYLHRPLYRRRARALGAHGERPVYGFGLCEIHAISACREYQAIKRLTRYRRVI